MIPSSRHQASLPNQMPRRRSRRPSRREASALQDWRIGPAHGNWDDEIMQNFCKLRQFSIESQGFGDMSYFLRNLRLWIYIYTKMNHVDGL